MIRLTVLLAGASTTTCRMLWLALAMTPVHSRSAGVVGYDTRQDNVITGDDLGGWTAKLRADAKIGEQFSAFAMIMYGEKSSAYTTGLVQATTPPCRSSAVLLPGFGEAGSQCRTAVG